MENAASESELDLIQTTLRKANPDAIVQIGTGSLRCAEAIIQTVRELPSAQLTIIVSDADKTVFSQLRQQKLDQWADFIHLPADQVLPDFYFQEQRFDFAVINPPSSQQETLVGFYYINKLLSKNSILMVNEPPENGVRELCRHVLNTGDYEVVATSQAQGSMSRLERLLRERYQQLPQLIKARTDQLINPALLETDAMLGLAGNTIVFNKLTGVAKEPQWDEMDVDAMIEAMS